jgi:DNA-binding transcriptional regulator YiaG
MEPGEFKQIRFGLGLSQMEMGEEMGVNVRTIQKWEGNETSIPGPAVKLARIIANKDKEP